MIGYMIRLAHEYSPLPILQQPVAKLETSEKTDLIKVPQQMEQLQQFVAKIPCGHNILLMEKVKDLTSRLWYMYAHLSHVAAPSPFANEKLSMCSQLSHAAAHIPICKRGIEGD